jgi:hypothetical protein
LSAYDETAPSPFIRNNRAVADGAQGDRQERPGEPAIQLVGTTLSWLPACSSETEGVPRGACYELRFGSRTTNRSRCISGSERMLAQLVIRTLYILSVSETGLTGAKSGIFFYFLLKKHRSLFVAEKLRGLG